MQGRAREGTERTMMEHKIPAGNWLMHLADVIEGANDGDVIIVATDAAREIARSAIKRMRPELDVRIVVEAR